jgi:hypothetical protein
MRARALVASSTFYGESVFRLSILILDSTGYFIQLQRVQQVLWPTAGMTLVSISNRYHIGAVQGTLADPGSHFHKNKSVDGKVLPFCPSLGKAMGWLLYTGFNSRFCYLQVNRILWASFNSLT